MKVMKLSVYCNHGWMFCEEYGDMAPVEVMRMGIREPGNVAKHVGDKGTTALGTMGDMGGKGTGGWGRTT